MRVIIVGAGAMGSLYGGLLSKAGEDVLLVDVNQAHIDAVNTAGLRLDLDDTTHIVRLNAARAEQAEGNADLIVLFTKTYHSKAALTSARHLIGDATLLMSIQNGLGAAERLSAFSSPERIVVGMSTVPADFKGPGHVVSHTGEFAETTIMSADGQESAGLLNIAETFTAAGLPCKVDPLVENAIWSKVAFNCAMNAIGAICNAPPGIIESSRVGIKLVQQVIAEVASVAAAKGLVVNESTVSDMVKKSMRNHKMHKPSMLQDLEAGRPTEIDALNGAVAREAERLKLTVPVTATLWHLIKIAEIGHTGNSTIAKPTGFNFAISTR